MPQFPYGNPLPTNTLVNWSPPQAQAIAVGDFVPQPTSGGNPPGTVVINADGQAVKRKSRKAYSENSEDAIHEIFGLGEPYIIGSKTVDEFLTHHPYLITRDAYPMAAPKVLIGVEVEVENVLRVDPNINLLFWQTKQDGSLRNKGFEFVTPGCISTGQVEYALKQLFDGLNPDVDFSSRTSIHIHMDVRQLNLNQLVGLLLTYTAVENLLFKYVGLNRRTNIFCVPLTETGLFDGLAANPKLFMWSIDQHWSKYTALNLLPILQLGSIEFRHMPGTKNLKQVLGWIDLITRLKTYCYRHPLPVIISQIAELNGTSRYKQFVESVFGEASVFLDLTNLTSDMEKPVYIVKNSVISNKFDEEVKKNPKTESHLGLIINGWAVKLKKSQYQALIELCRVWGNPYHEKVFRDLVSRPTIYLTKWPKYSNLIHQALDIAQPKELPF